MTDHTDSPDVDPPDEDDSALDPAEMLALLENQQRSVANQFGSFVTLIIAAWGVVWLIGFGALWAIDGLKPAFSLPTPLGASILATLIAIAIAISIIASVRSNRGVRPSKAAAFTGAVYGSAWSISMTGLWVLGVAMIANGLPPEFAGYYFSAGYVLMTGVLFIVSAAIWQAVPALIAGVWLVIVAAFSPFFGIPGKLSVPLARGGRRVHRSRDPQPRARGDPQAPLFRGSRSGGQPSGGQRRG